jgi:hypothetical protein
MVGRTKGVIRPRKLVAIYTPLGPGPNGLGPPWGSAHPKGIMGGLCMHKEWARRGMLRGSDREYA